MIYNRDRIDVSDSSEGNIKILYQKSHGCNISLKMEMDFNILCFPLDGEKVIGIQNKKVVVNNSQFFLISSNSHFMTEIRSNHSGRYKGVYMMFTNKVLIDYFLKYPIPKIDPVINEEITNRYFICKRGEFINDYFLPSLQYLLENEGDISNQLSNIKFEEIIHYIITRHPNALHWFDRLLQMKNFKIQKIVESVVYTDAKITEIAALCHLSISTFKRYFISIYGVSPQKYFIDRKMKRAMFILENEKYKRIKIHSQLGFKTSQAFSKSFKKYYGVCPSVFFKNKNNRS